MSAHSDILEPEPIRGAFLAALSALEVYDTPDPSGG